MKVPKFALLLLSFENKYKLQATQCKWYMYEIEEHCSGWLHSSSLCLLLCMLSRPKNRDVKLFTSLSLLTKAVNEETQFPMK